MEYVFFSATRSALDNITELYNFIHPLKVSLLYTRQKIEKLQTEHPEYTDANFQEFIDPLKKVHGVGYRNAFINTIWDEQEQNLAWILLNNLFSVHEGWAFQLYDERFKPYNYDGHTFQKNLEFPGITKKITSYFTKGKNKSVLMENTFLDVYKSRSKLDFTKLENYMLMYRFFKEARNCYMHSNRVATSKVITAYNDYIKVATLASLDTSEIPQINPPVLGQPIQLNLRGVIGFSDFLRRILIITDIMLIGTHAAEDEVLSYRQKEIEAANGNVVVDTLSNNQARAKQQILKYTNQNGFLKPIWSEDYKNFLIQNGIFKK